MMINKTEVTREMICDGIVANLRNKDILTEKDVEELKTNPYVEKVVEYDILENKGRYFKPFRVYFNENRFLHTSARVLYQIDDEDVREDFYRLKGMSTADNDEHIEKMYEEYIRLTKNDNNLKISFLFILDKCLGDIEYALYQFRNLGVQALM